MKVLLNKDDLKLLKSLKASPNNYLKKFYETNEKSSICNDLMVLRDNTNFSINQFLDREGDVHKTIFSTWLKDNDTNIDFNVMRNTIECVHEVNYHLLNDYINLVNPMDQMTLGEIKTEISNQHGTYSYNYQHYLDFNFNSSNRISFELRENYSPFDSHFSIALFNSIETNKRLTNDSIIYFRKVDLFGPERIVFSIENADGTQTHYDFSQIPPGARRVLYHLFSPL